MILLADIGGTKMRIATASTADSFEVPVVEKTPDSYREGIEILNQHIKNNNPEKVIIGIAGTLNKEKTGVMVAPNLSSWEGKNIKEDLETTAEVYIENDTALVGLGEATAGSGKDAEIVVYITVSTGVGGVRIVNKKIDINRYGFEPGHQIVDLDNTVCGPTCQNIEHHGIGHLDNLVSGKALEQKTGMKAYEVTDEKIWTEHADNLAVGLYNTIVHWSPDVMVLGGSMIVGDPAIPFDRIVEKVGEHMKAFKQSPELKKAELGDFGGLYGGLYYAYNLV
jgi:predicted NBD/HSP70 family sugar kinase